MKLQGIIGSLLSLLLLTVACDDDLNSVGLSTKPNRDNVYIHADTIYLSGDQATRDYVQTVQFDSIYFGTNTQSMLLLGYFNDPLFGSLKTDFLCQFYYSKFSSDSIKNNKADSVALKIYYSSWVGDSIAPMVAKVYPVKQGANFDKNEYRYTNIDLYNKYVAPAQPWVSKSYTARDLGVHDSIYYHEDYRKNVSFDLSASGLDSYLIEEWKRNPATFQSLIKFTDYFPGIYITTSAGEGNILKVSYVSLSFYYTSYTKNESDELVESKDTTYFNIASDIIVSSQYKNENEHLTAPHPEMTFIKAPAGVYTQYTLPLKEISKKLDNREINSVEFAVSAYPQEQWKYALGAPSTLMLIRKDSLTSFFVTPHVASAPVAYKASYSSTFFKYDFGDISAMIKKGIAEGKDELDVMVIPVTEGTTTAYYNGAAYTISLYTAYDINPTGLRLRKGTDPAGKNYVRLKIMSSDLSKR